MLLWVATASLGEAIVWWSEEVVQQGEEVIQQLLEKGVDVDTRENYSQTPLLEAATIKYKAIV
ncbi:hypothetical protein GQ53DRAFT_647725 [Thozetella sp. PMI_491]|nr:hypothetical protein GQ53DRAFT_647725 [Thozetella sp. PMI_491]